MTLQDRIVRDPAICAGQPIIRGTRVPVRTILGYLAHGETAAAILSDFPSLSDEDVRAVVAFAAASASEDLPAPTPAPHQVKVAGSTDDVKSPRHLRYFSATPSSIIRPCLEMRGDRTF